VKIKIIYIGKTVSSFLLDGESEYLNRLKHYIKFEKIEISDIKNQKNLTIDQIKHSEAKELIKKIQPGDNVYLLDENGTTYSSHEFAKFISKNNSAGLKNLTFIIGGAYGFSDDIHHIAKGKISLSKMTFSHQMVRMIFFEQLYRAMTIIKGEPYHHE
jgi:23S rRNA (pseudouridine1915-N3)-methyltransferase